MRDRQSECHLLDRPSPGAWIVASHLQRQLDLRRDGGRDDLGLGVLGDVANSSRKLSRAGGESVDAGHLQPTVDLATVEDRKSTRLNSSHLGISYAVFCLKKKTHCPRSVLGAPLRQDSRPS